MNIVNMTNWRYFISSYRDHFNGNVKQAWKNKSKRFFACFALKDYLYMVIQKELHFATCMILLEQINLCVDFVTKAENVQ